MNNSLEYAKQREEQFLTLLKERVGEDSYEYATGVMLWRSVVSDGEACYMLGSYMVLQKHFRDAVKSDEFQFTEKASYEDLDTQSILDVLCEAGIAAPSVTFYEDPFEDDDSETEIVNKGNLDEFDQECFDMFVEEFDKSCKAVKDLSEEYGYSFDDALSKRMSTSTENPFWFVYTFSDDDRLKMEECFKKYTSLRGDVVNPESGREGFDPFFHVVKGVRGVGNIGFFDPRYVNINDRLIEEALLEIAKEDDELMAKAKELAMAKHIDSLVNK